MQVPDRRQFPELPAQHDRHGRLVQLDADPLGRSVDVRLLQEPAAVALVAMSAEAFDLRVNPKKMTSIQD